MKIRADQGRRMLDFDAGTVQEKIDVILSFYIVKHVGVSPYF